MTLPLIHALRETDPRTRRQIIKTVKKKKKARADLQRIGAFVREHGGLDYARRRMKQHAETAAVMLETLPPTPARETLLDLVAYTVQRKK